MQTNKCWGCGKDVQSRNFCGSCRYKKYYRENSEKMRERHRKYYAAHLGSERIKSRKYHATPRGFFSVLKQSAKRRNIELSLDSGQFVEWWNNQRQLCHYCKLTPGRRLTIDRVDNSKGYELSNIVLACYRCNTIKSNFFNEEEMLKIGEIIFLKNGG